MDIQKDWLLPTGNDCVALPDVGAADGAAQTVNVLMRRFRGVVELSGAKGAPFIEPSAAIGAKALALAKDKSLAVTREDNWVPAFRTTDKKTHEITLRILAPQGERGFVLDWRVKNLSSKKLDVTLGAEGCWGGIALRGADARPLALSREAEHCALMGGRHLAFTAGAAGPELAFAVGGTDDLDSFELTAGAAAKGTAFSAGKRVAAGDKPLRWAAGRKVTVEAQGEGRFGLLVGFGLDAQSAVGSCLEMRRQGLERLDERTQKALAQRRRGTGDLELDQLLNWNLNFGHFYASGVTLDSEETVCVASRSPRSDACGRYDDRTAMLQAFPALLLVDPRRARLVLEHTVLTQGRNLGQRSRFIDGMLVEPGFELDQMCATIIALASYTRHTGDTALANDYQVRKVLRQAERTLAARKHPQVNLYETLCGPAGVLEPLPYLAYDNVLVWRMLNDLAELKDRGGREQEGRQHREQAERVRAAIWQNLVAEGPKGRMFVYAADLKGQTRFHNEPAGCLQLLPYWGFCTAEDTVWRNTVAWLRGKDFAHSNAGAPFEDLGGAGDTAPWTLAVCSSLLCGRREEAAALLKRAPLDSRLACRALSPKDGECQSGPADASAAAFLAWALWKSWGKAGA